MSPVVSLLRDLTILLLTASVVTLIFRRFRLPLILGYLASGLIVNLASPLFRNVVEMHNLEAWAEIGVIFLLFSIGLEFSYKRLLHMGKAPVLTGLLEVPLVCAVGFALSLAMGMSTIESAFLGAALAISSTSIVARTFTDLHLKGRRFVSQVYGILLVEDGLAILLLVALATLGSGQDLGFLQILGVGARFLFFLALCFISGIYIIPSALRKVRPLLSNETTVIVSVGLCLLMVLVSTLAGFSAAMGAFLMGSILAGTPEGPRIEQLLEPLRDLFSAVFFVSIGLLIDPQALFDNFGLVLLLTLVLILTKFLAVSTSSVLAGQKLRNAMLAGLSLTQIGEFSFLIAKLGLSTGSTSKRFFPLIVLVSVITSFTTPMLLKFSDPLVDWIEKRFPENWLQQLEVYRQHLAARDQTSGLRLVLRAYGWQILMNVVVIIGITLLVRSLLWDFLDRLWPFSANSLSHFAITSVIMLCLPFFWALIMSRPAKSTLQNITSLQRLRGLQLGLFVIRLALAAALLVFIVGEFLSVRSSLWMMLGLFICLYLLRSSASKTYQKIEEKFLDHLNEKEREEIQQTTALPELAPWDAELVEVKVSSDSQHLGQNYLEAGLRDRYGVTVALIERGSKRILAPNRDEQIFPGDLLYLIGTEEQILAARGSLETPGSDEKDSLSSDFGLEFLVIEPDSVVVGKNIRESGLREKLEGLVVGLERDGKRLLNPDSGLVLQPWDLIWLVGSREKIDRERKIRRKGEPKT